MRVWVANAQISKAIIVGDYFLKNDLIICLSKKGSGKINSPPKAAECICMVAMPRVLNQIPKRKRFEPRTQKLCGWASVESIKAGYSESEWMGSDRIRP